MYDVALSSTIGGNQYDVFLKRGYGWRVDVYLRSTIGSNQYDTYAYRQRYDDAAVQAEEPPDEFPVQYDGFKIQKTGSTISLCLVAEADAATGMGGVPKMRKTGVTYAIYLVETTDPNASPVRIKTSTGTKSIRLKT